MSLPGPVSYRISEGDHYAFAKLMFRRKWLRSYVGPLVVGIGASLVLIGMDRPVWLALVPLIAGAVAMLAAAGGGFLSLKRRSRAIYRESAGLGDEVTLSFQLDGFEISQPRGFTSMNWNELARWDEDHEVFAIFPNRQIAITFPKQQVSEEVVNYMREQMKLSGLPRPWKLRK